jgi:hypothetical protein
MKNLKTQLLSLVLIFGFLVSAVSCKDEGDTNNATTDSTATAASPKDQEIARLKQETVAKDSAINSFMDAFNTIQENLNTIKEKEKVITNTAKGGDVKNKQDQIVEDIQSIYDLMNQNKQKLGNLSAKFKKANLRIVELEKAIENLNQQIIERDAEIADLKDKLEKMNLELSDITAHYEEASQQAEEKTSKLNTAYYAFGTSKELKKQGVLTKEGGIIGLGKTNQLGKDFNRNYFTKIDITQTTSFPLAARHAKVVTNHPTNSYKIEGTKDKVERFVITNPDDFWASSKYLVIIID